MSRKALEIQYGRRIGKKVYYITFSVYNLFIEMDFLHAFRHVQVNLRRGPYFFMCTYKSPEVIKK